MSAAKKKQRHVSAKYNKQQEKNKENGKSLTLTKPLVRDVFLSIHSIVMIFSNFAQQYFLFEVIVCYITLN